ncbi:MULTISPECIES: GNAT family N-acetyltransferase [Alteribacter]|uniref:GNAT family N-acetyltransferase n=1 Tax=Alteribacter keqinensis TaxID=2483800 RepID=A0A3M7TUH4_9BACI|nr:MULTISPECIES: GNAT family N-acetyltransferase [Alteribacter]MBM7097405.1 GNAT family N-acetyltransferase [Alteribacter salitolerans]RNA68652.1 GNAT family N-acetyltransferase [Alteribacter keqinensis]
MWHLKQFEELTTPELYRILKERVDIFVVEQKCPYPEIDNKDLTACHLFKQENGRIIAYARILPPEDRNAPYTIGRVIVNKEFRREGYGNDLMERAIRFILQKNPETEITLSAQTYIKHFYQSHGFKEVSDEYLEDGIPHVTMILKIDTL